MKLYQHPITMVNFVLNYLCRETCKCFNAGLEFSRLPLHFYSLITSTLSGSSEQRKTAFFCIVGSRFLYDFGIEHNHICAVIIKSNNSFMHTDHIRRHTYTAVFVSNESIQQILRHLQIFFCCNLRFPRKKNRRPRKSRHPQGNPPHRAYPRRQP